MKKIEIDDETRKEFYKDLSLYLKMRSDMFRSAAENAEHPETQNTGVTAEDILLRIESADYTDCIRQCAKNVFALHREQQFTYSDRIDFIKCSCPSVEYSLYGELMHRGIHCPSPLQEYLVTNVKKGRAVRKKPLRKPYYIYYYDENRTLMGAEMFGTDFHTFELLIYKGETEYGLTYDDHDCLRTASVVVGAKKPLVYCCFENMVHQWYKVTYERYHYHGDDIVSYEHASNGDYMKGTEELLIRKPDVFKVCPAENGYELEIID